MEICPRTACHNHTGNASFLIQIPSPFDKRRNRFFIPMHYPLHQFVPYHKIGCTSILVYQQKGRSALHGLNNICRLRSASAGIFRIKAACLLSVGKVIHKHGNVVFFHASAVLCPNLHGIRHSYHILPAVSRYMIVYPQFQCFQQRGFSMISAAHHQGNPFTDSHTFYRTFMRKLQFYFHRLRRGKCDAVLHRLIRNTGFPRKHRSVGNKCHQTQPVQSIPDIFPVIRQKHRFLYIPAVQPFIIKYVLNTLGQKIK